jgi:trans-aconitate 2-methyltransferase
LRRVCRNVYLGSFQQTEDPEEPTEFDSMDELARFLKTVVLGHHLERLPESEREPIAVMLAARLAQRGELVVDYLRLNILAKREVTA